MAEKWNKTSSRAGSAAPTGSLCCFIGLLMLLVTLYCCYAFMCIPHVFRTLLVACPVILFILFVCKELVPIRSAISNRLRIWYFSCIFYAWVFVEHKYPQLLSNCRINWSPETGLALQLKQLELMGFFGELKSRQYQKKLILRWEILLWQGQAQRYAPWFWCLLVVYNRLFSYLVVIT